MEFTVPEVSLRIASAALAPLLASHDGPVSAGISRISQKKILFLRSRATAGGEGWLWIRQHPGGYSPGSINKHQIHIPSGPGLMWDLFDDGHSNLSLSGMPMHQASGIRVIGPGLEWIPCNRRRPNNIAAGPSELRNWLQVAHDRHEATEGAKSRLIGVLGKESVATLGAIHVGIIGCGRTGSQIADSLARQGCKLILVDSDVVEHSNLDAMLAYPHDVGLPKPLALAERLKDLTEVTPVALPVEHPQAIASIRAADILISCVDDDGARAVCSLAASAWMQPHVDIATGIGRVERGADIRLSLPGESCLRCLGGFGQPEDLDRMQHNHGRVQSWKRERRQGSLRSLNGIAVHFAQRLIEELVRGTLVASTWWQIDESLPTGFHAQERVRSAMLNRTCPVCTLAGIGDRVIPRIPEVMKMLADHDIVNG